MLHYTTMFSHSSRTYITSPCNASFILERSHATTTTIDFDNSYDSLWQVWGLGFKTFEGKKKQCWRANGVGMGVLKKFQV